MQSPNKQLPLRFLKPWVLEEICSFEDVLHPRVLFRTSFPAKIFPTDLLSASLPLYSWNNRIRAERHLRKEQKRHHSCVRPPADNLMAGKRLFDPENRKFILGSRLLSDSQLTINLFFLSVKCVFFNITWLYPIHSSCF